MARSWYIKYTVYLQHTDISQIYYQIHDRIFNRNPQPVINMPNFEPNPQPVVNMPTSVDENPLNLEFRNSAK